MAGNSNSGRNPVFPHSEEELQRLIHQYKADLAAGLFPRASWPHFAAHLGVTEADLSAVMALDDKDSAYRSRARELKKMACWVRGQMMSAQGWHGQLTSRAIFALKQDMGDGVRWSDQDARQTGPVEVTVSFGGGDPRGRKAAK